MPRFARGQGPGVRPSSGSRSSRRVPYAGCMPARPVRGWNARALRASAMARKVIAPNLRISAMIGNALLAARSASALTLASAAPRAASILGLPSLTPSAFAAASVDFVRPATKALSAHREGLLRSAKAIGICQRFAPSGVIHNCSPSPSESFTIHDLCTRDYAHYGEVGKSHVGITARSGCRIPTNLPTNLLDANGRQQTVRDGRFGLSKVVVFWGVSDELRRPNTFKWCPGKDCALSTVGY